MSSTAVMRASTSRVSTIRRRLPDPAIAGTFAVVIAAWAISSQFAPSYVIPPISNVVREMIHIVTTASPLQALLTTLARVAVGIVSAFVAGTLLGLAMGRHQLVARFLLPLVRFIQGIPSLSWVVLAVIWFTGVELRIWYILVIVTLPGFVLQAHDAYRGIPQELRDMGRSFRPTRWPLFREITLPAITPDLFTGWKVNLGLGVRVVLVAELVGAPVGVGNELLTSEQLFDMTGVVAWTLWLGVFLVIVQALTAVVEARVLRYRPEPAAPDAHDGGR